MPRKTKGTPDHVDKHVGSRLRIRRALLGISQEKLADAIGLTFQQIQKYERGLNRISAGRLFRFSNILDVPISYFYDELEAANDSSLNTEEGISQNTLQSKETINLLRIYYKMPEPMRKACVKFIKSMNVRNAVAG